MSPCPHVPRTAKLPARFGRRLPTSQRGNGPKNSLTRCEAEAFLSLTSGHQVIVLDNETGEVWRGSVDMPLPEQGFLWVVTDLSERKLHDIALHSVWRPNTRQFCSREHQETGNT